MGDDIEDIALEDLRDGDQRRILGIGLDVVGASGSGEKHISGNDLLNRHRRPAPALDLNLESLLGEKTARIGVERLCKADEIAERREIADLHQLLGRRAPGEK